LRAANHIWVEVEGIHRFRAELLEDDLHTNASPASDFEHPAPIRGAAQLAEALGLVVALRCLAHGIVHQELLDFVE
jgi:hypothetical protein